MIIKFQDKFDSIFYAILLSNLTGNYLSPNNEQENLFTKEDILNIDLLNWQEILVNHEYKYGQIKWYDSKCISFNMFKDDIELVLRHWNTIKYKIIIIMIRQAVKFGIDYIYELKSPEAQIFYKFVNQVKSEVSFAFGEIKFFNLQKANERFLLSYYQEESNIGDLIINELKNKYNNCQIILKTANYIYLYYHHKFFQFKIDQQTANKQNYLDYWDEIYNKFIAPQIHNKNLAKLNFLT
jgi:hypothetical protein